MPRAGAQGFEPRPAEQVVDGLEGADDAELVLQDAADVLAPQGTHPVGQGGPARGRSLSRSSWSGVSGAFRPRPGRSAGASGPPVLYRVTQVRTCRSDSSTSAATWAAVRPRRACRTGASRRATLARGSARIRSASWSAARCRWTCTAASYRVATILLSCSTAGSYYLGTVSVPSCRPGKEVALLVYIGNVDVENRVVA